MFFRPRKQADQRRQQWREFAERLELQDASAVAERLRRWLDLEVVRLEPLYALKREGQPSLYLFDYLRRREGPAGSVEQRASVCLLRAEAPFTRLALRALPKRNEVLESLEASRTGSRIVAFPHDPDFAERVTVYARDDRQTVRLLGAGARALVRRSLLERAPESAEVSLVVGERHLIVTCEGEVELTVLELLSSDLLALYATFVATPAD